MNNNRKIACFSMEIGLNPDMPTYAGGLGLLQALGYRNLERFHMNEGHASLLAFELFEQQARLSGHETANMKDVNAVRQKCVFTTHTPVRAGHDQFPLDLVKRILGEQH